MKSSGENTGRKMLFDLEDAFLMALRVWKPEYDPKAYWDTRKLVEESLSMYGSKIGGAIKVTIDWFKAHFCEEDEMKLNVAQDDNGNYGFHLYKVLPQDDAAWNVVEVAKLLHAVGKASNRLRELTICFLHLLIEKCQLSTWYNGGFEMPEMWMEDRIEEMQAEAADEYRKKF